MNRIGPGSDRSYPIRGAVETPGREVSGLRDGASVIFKALSPSSDGRWTVLLNGARLNAAVSTALSSGGLYSARVEKLPGRSDWILRVLGPAGEARAAEFLRAAGLPGDEAATLVLRALMAESLPLDPRQIARLRAALLRRGPSEERAALLARAAAKGLDPEAFADALDASDRTPAPEDGQSDGSSGYRHENGDRAGSERDGADGSGEKNASDGRESGPEGASEDGDPSGDRARIPPVRWKDFQAPEPPGPGERSAMAALLRHLASRTEGEGSPLQLFNARSGPRGRWIYVPYRFERAGVAFSGTLRILIPEGDRSDAILSADVNAERGQGRSGRYEFTLRGGAEHARIALVSPDAVTPARLARSMRKLSEDLANFGCLVEQGSDPDSGDPGSALWTVDDHA